MIKVQPRANVPDEFVEEVAKIATQRVKDIQEEINNMSPFQAKMHYKKIGMAVSRLALLARRDPDAIDQMKTILRSLPYTEYAVKAHDRTYFNWETNKDERISETYLYGLSKDVVIPFEGQKWDMGPYQVWVPANAFFKNGKHEYQFIPNRAPETYRRTPHHHAGYEKNPFGSATCWGTFGEIVTSLTQDGDVPELFRSIYIYLCRYNPHSPLGDGRLSTRLYPFARIA
jgi:hypothetical protein